MQAKFQVNQLNQTAIVYLNSIHMGALATTLVAFRGKQKLNSIIIHLKKSFQMAEILSSS